MPTTNIDIKATDRTKKAFKTVRGNVERLGGAFGKVKGAIGVLVGALAVKKMADFTSELRNQADEIGKMAARVDMSVEALQRLSFAGELAGEGIQGFRDNLVKFARNVGDARKGTKTLIDEFKELRIDLRDQNGDWKDTEQLLFEVSDRYMVTASAQRKLSSAMLLFGRGGRKMVNMLSEGSQKTKALGYMLTQLGGVMEQDVIDTSEEANDAWTVIGKYWDGLVAKVLPSLNKKIIETGEALQRHKGINPEAFMTFRRLNERLKEVNKEIIGYEDVLAKTNKSTIDFTGTTQRLNLEAKKNLKILTDEKILIEKQLTQREVQAKKVKQLQEAETERLKNTEYAESQIFEFTDTQFKRTQDSARNTARIKLYEEKRFIDEKKRLFEQLREFTRTGEEQERFEIIEEHKNRMATIEGFYGDEVSMAKTKERVIREEYRKTTEQLEAFNVKRRDSAISTISQMTHSMSGFNKSYWQASKALSISETIMNTYTAATAALKVQPPPVGMAFAGTITALGLANVARINKETYSGKAMGGNVNRGESYIVGEKGKELFTPYQSGNITPNHELGGGTTNINFNIQANDASGFDELLYRRRGMIVGMINQALNNSGQRGIL